MNDLRQERPKAAGLTGGRIMTTTKWNIDLSHSGINFAIRHMVVAKVRGRFAKFSGALDLDDDDLARSVVEVTIDASSIDTGTAQRDAHLRSPDFFDVEKFPELRFRSTRIEKLDDDRFRVAGDLTIRDTTREVVLDCEAGGRAKDPWGNERVGFVARTTLDRKDFGLKWNQALEAGGVLVGDRVDIELDVQGVRAEAVQAA
jgi:polyisoprenoid-binding protein YceI